MSEELLQTIPQQIGKYTYYRLGATTLDQLRNNGIIPKRDYQKLKAKKPDGLVLYHGDIKAVVEYKQPKDLASEKQIDKAIKQEIDVAKALCKILIVTDGSQTFWINALNGERVMDAKGHAVSTVFHPFAVKNTANLEYLLDEIGASLTRKNSTIRSAKLIDPTPLASRLWQTIWVATGKSPVKCLYNVVELFIFKFLSDLQVLGEDYAFNRIYKMALDNPEEALEYYAKNTRSRIYRLFPQGKDGTTIINGTIFVTETGEPNLSQSILFFRSLDHLRKYTEEFGSLTKINKQFKTKLYESFLQQEVEALGQYFTPRKIIQSVIRMAGLDSPSFQFAGKRIADPFCGLGGFPMELLNMNETMRMCYTPSSECIITTPFVIHGFDKGFERDDERTIILAKANMLIYLAELLFAHPQCSKEFAEVFNDTFTLFQDNLGTFGHIIKEESEKYDFILSNPPYVTSGSSIIKEEIQKTPRTTKEYPINALGLEGLSLEWIVKSLRQGGKAFIIIPDGLLGRVGGKKLRDYILRECYLDAIVSLPDRTFFANFEHTYILAITKKHQAEDVQTDPVFTYLVSNIGERLTSVKREEINEDDLPEMEGLFRIFTSKGASKELIEKQSGRCKIQDVERFRSTSHWVVDRWWSRNERIALGAEESVTSASRNEIESLVREFNAALTEYDQFISTDALAAVPNTAEVVLGNTSLFNLFIGPRVLKKNAGKAVGDIPVYSANVFAPMGFAEKSNIEDFSHPCIRWGIDGNFDFNLVAAGEIFATTDHCGVIQILEPTIMPEYLLYALNLRRMEESFDRSFRASLTNMRQFTITIPVDRNGKFDVEAQTLIAAQFTGAREKKERLATIKEKLDSIFDGYLTSKHLS
jgi:type I restriction-modification system DNA methylase subunit